MDYECEEFGYRLCQNHKNLSDPSVLVKHQFPEIREMTWEYFLRAGIWMEIFYKRKKFEPMALTTSKMGFCTASLVASILTLPVALIHPFLAIIPVLFFLAYLYAYMGFWRFVAQKSTFYLPIALLLNMYFSIIIVLGATWWLFKCLLGWSKMDNFWQIRPS